MATYGQIAELAGFPGGARVAAAALKVSRGALVPWQRIVGKHGPKHGRIAIYDPVGAAMQRHLLETEKVVVDERGRISLSERQSIFVVELDGARKRDVSVQVMGL